MSVHVRDDEPAPGTHEHLFHWVTQAIASSIPHNTGRSPVGNYISELKVANASNIAHKWRQL